MSNLKTTPLNELHKEAGAKMVDFFGWEMPVQYKGILEEHHATRNQAGLFDVSHMGEIWIEGPEAFQAAQYLTTADLSKVSPGRAVYCMMCYPNGGTVDDLIVYVIEENSYLLVVNAANTEKDYEWVKENCKDFNVTVTDKSLETAQIALQGPLAKDILQKIVDVDLEPMKPFDWQWGYVEGVKSIVSRTGYTGEDGFELYCDAQESPKIWNKILEAGEGKVQPVGLGARDSLRFEACLALYGNELSENISPIEAGLKFAVKLDQEGDFIGKEALKKQDEEGPPRRTVAFEMIDRGVPRSGYRVFKDEEEIGEITTGYNSPTLGKNIGLALVKAGYVKVDDEMEVEIRGKKLKAKVIKKPFYKRG